MQNLKILNTREIKDIRKMIKEQWGAETPLDYAFLMDKENKIYIVNREIGELDLSKIYINSLGMYFAEATHGELRLTIEGSQLIGKDASKNVVELKPGPMKLWLRGFDIEMKEPDAKGYVIVKSGDDFLGCGRYRDGKLLNFVPKTRRLNLHEE